MALYRKKPVIVEAIQWNGRNEMEIANFIGGNLEMDDNGLLIHTLEGTMTASVGDYVIKGVNGEFYPCKPGIFEKTHVPASFE